MRRSGIALLSNIVKEPYVLPKVADCQYCHAKKFYYESSSFCCSDGQVVLQENKLPDVLIDFFTGDTPEASCFHKYVKTYNNLFAFTSFGVSYDKELCKHNNGIYTFRIQGQTYHFIDQLISDEGSRTLLQLENRMAFSKKLSESSVSKLATVMEQNPYASFFRSLRNVPDLNSYQIVLRTDSNNDQGTFNKPNVSQIAALWVERNKSEQGYGRHIRVYTKEGHSQRVKYYYGCYDALQYPLLYAFGETG